MPTAGARLVHAPGDGSTLAVHDLGWARVSGLVCWENDAAGRTPLHYAAEATLGDTARLLCAHGAEPSRPDRAGKTPHDS